MTEINQDIADGFYSGNSKDLRVPVLDKDGLAFALTNCEVTYVVYDKEGNVVLTKSSADASQVEILVSPTNVFVVHLLPPDTLHLNGLYRHMANVVDTNGYEETVFTGKLQIFKAHAQRPRQASRQAYISGG